MKIRNAPSLDRAGLPLLRERFERLVANVRPAWGKMTPSEMCEHCAQTIEMSCERGAHALIGPWAMRLAPVRWLVIEVLPWPKGIPAPPEYLPGSDGDFEAARRRLFAAFDRFIAKLESDPKHRSLHPAFGMLSMKQWSRLGGIHCDWHLRQFGL
jgi:hypothetical protein